MHRFHHKLIGVILALLLGVFPVASAFASINACHDTQTMSHDMPTHVDMDKNCCDGVDCDALGQCLTSFSALFYGADIMHIQHHQHFIAVVDSLPFPNRPNFLYRPPRD